MGLRLQDHTPAYLKALSCNFKRMVRILLAEMSLPDAVEV